MEACTLRGLDHSKIVVQINNDAMTGYTRCIFCDSEIVYHMKINARFRNLPQSQTVSELRTRVEKYLYGVHLGFFSDAKSVYLQNKDGLCPYQPTRSETEKTYLDHGMGLSKDFVEMKKDQESKQAVIDNAVKEAARHEAKKLADGGITLSQGIANA